jgi:hypothetical protein
MADVVTILCDEVAELGWGATHIRSMRRIIRCSSTELA